MAEDVEVRPAQPGDAEVIFSMVRELAAYERAADAVKSDADRLRQALFGPERHAEALLAERGGQPVGFTLFFKTFSTWEGRPGMWIEDLYVREDHRRGGAGQALFDAVAALARQRGCARLEWAVLRWNQPALRFYERQRSAGLEDWVTYRLELLTQG